MNTKNILIFLNFYLLHVPFIVDAQIFSDTTYYVGVVKTNTLYGSSTTNLCYLNNTQYIETGTILFLSGSVNCIENNYYSNSYFEFIQNGEPFLIKKDDVETKEAYFENFLLLSDSLKQKLKASAIQKEKLYKIGLAQIEIKERQEVIDFLKNTKKSGICTIDKTAIDMSEYTDGTGARFTFYNPNSKDIKYLWITFTGYNRVDDKVLEFGKSAQTVQCIGPIKPESYSTFEFEYVWMTDIVEYLKINQIKIQFMDNTTKTVSSIESITLPNHLKKYITE